MCPIASKFLLTVVNIAPSVTAFPLSHRCGRCAFLVLQPSCPSLHFVRSFLFPSGLCPCPLSLWSSHPFPSSCTQFNGPRPGCWWGQAEPGVGRGRYLSSVAVPSVHASVTVVSQGAFCFFSMSPVTLSFLSVCSTSSCHPRARSVAATLPSPIEQKLSFSLSLFHLFGCFSSRSLCCLVVFLFLLPGVALPF